MATAAQVIDRAANDLGLLRLGQSLQSQDNTRITAGYAEVYAQLQKDELATWAYTGTVPDDVVPHVAALIAENCLGTYSVSEARYKRVMLSANVAKRDIRKYVTPAYVSQDEPTGY